MVCLINDVCTCQFIGVFAPLLPHIGELDYWNLVERVAKSVVRIHLFA